MKQLIIGLSLGLLAGCTSTELINGTYKVDAKYSASTFAKAVNQLPETNNSSWDENNISLLEKSITDEEAVVTIEYPELRFTRKIPTPVNELLQIKKIGENQFVLLAEIDGKSKEVPLMYDPVEESILWGTYKYIKR